MELVSERPQVSEFFPIVWRSDIAYERARIGRVFNYRQPSRYPVAVVEAAHVGHVVEAVQLANRLGCRVSVRSGGHSWAAWSVREGSILIDLAKLYAFDLDEQTGVLRVSPSFTGQMVNKLLGDRGLMFPGGHCPDVALGGFLLQGGMGWNCKNWGWACERVLAIDVVTADGQELHSSETENSDLLWAARGSGPGFPAIVTCFHVQTMPAFSHISTSLYMYDKKDYRAAMSWATSIAPTFDKDTEIVAVANYIHGFSGVHTTVLLTTFKRSEAEARTALQPAQDSAPQGHVLTWFAKPSSLAQEYDSQHAANPNCHRYRVDNCYINNDADVVSVLEPAFMELPTQKSFSLWYSMAPGSRRSAKAGTMKDMALSMQTDHYFAVYGVNEYEYDDERCRAWVGNIFAKVERHSAGAYLGDSDFQLRGTKYWLKDEGCKLMELRKKWDSKGVVAGYLDTGDKSGVEGLKNVHEWEVTADGN